MRYSGLHICLTGTLLARLALGLHVHQPHTATQQEFTDAEKLWERHLDQQEQEVRRVRPRHLAETLGRHTGDAVSDSVNRDAHNGPRLQQSLESLVRGRWRISNASAASKEWEPAFEQEQRLYQSFLNGGLSRCAGKRLALYGSSFTRAIAWSLMKVFSGKELVTGLDTQISSYEPPPGTKVCMDWMLASNKDSCAYLSESERQASCQYTRGVGADVQHCGWPQAKLWGYDLASSSIASFKAVPIKDLTPILPKHRANSAFDMVYMFKGPPFTPEADHSALSQMHESFRPDIFVSESYVWAADNERQPSTYESIRAGVGNVFTQYDNCPSH